MFGYTGKSCILRETESGVDHREGRAVNNHLDCEPFGSEASMAFL